MDVDAPEILTFHAACRVFHKTDLGSAYAIPLPDGLYRITLHFLEFEREDTNKEPRSFTVKIEGNEELENYQPKPLVAEKHVVETRVDDAYLNIEFVRGLKDPFISAIEIRQLR